MQDAIDHATNSPQPSTALAVPKTLSRVGGRSRALLSSVAIPLAFFALTAVVLGLGVFVAYAVAVALPGFFLAAPASLITLIGAAAAAPIVARVVLRRAIEAVF